MFSKKFQRKYALTDQGLKNTKIQIPAGGKDFPCLDRNIQSA